MAGKTVKSLRRSVPEQMASVLDVDPVDVVDYVDGEALGRARIQWQSGDWQSLASLDRAVLYYHPDRRHLALLAAAGHLQLGDVAAARQLLSLAQQWGCSKHLIAQMLVAGVYNSMARFAALKGATEKASQYFETGLTVGMPGADYQALGQARIQRQLQQLGLPFGTEVLDDSEGLATAMLDRELSIVRAIDGVETLVQLLERNQYDLVIEFGTSASTLRVARILADFRAQLQDDRQVRFVSFGHLEYHRWQALTQLCQAGLDADVQLVLAPLHDWRLLENGDEYLPFYDCEATLDVLTQESGLEAKRILVITDSRLSTSARIACYPAGPIVHKYFTGAHVDLLIEHCFDEEGKNAARRWLTEFSEAGFECMEIEHTVGEDGCLVRIQGLKGKGAA